MASLEEVSNAIEALKNEGVQHYGQDEFEQAIGTWKEAAKLLLKAVCSGPEALASEKLSSLDHVINSNLGMAYFRIGNFSSCVMFCDKSLLRRKTMPVELLEKNLYRKAMAEYELGNFEKSKIACDDLLTHFPSNAAGKQLLKQCQRELKTEAKSERSTYEKLFQKLDRENRQAS